MNGGAKVPFNKLLGNSTGINNCSKGVQCLANSFKLASKSVITKVSVLRS